MPSSDGDPVESVVRLVRDALERARLLGSRSRIVVAVSGGADSLCLLDAVVAVRGTGHTGIVVGHVDHRLRPISTEDAAHVERIADGYGLRAETLMVDVPALARDERRGIEEAARLGRYRALSRLARSVGASAILTGHTRSDSVETLLLHLLRGSGPHGLRGIEPDERLDPVLVCDEQTEPGRERQFRLVRPLLDVDRAETAAYCEARSISWRADETNTDPRFARNRVRQHLLPVLRTYNPAVDVALDRLSRTMRDDARWIDSVVERTYRRIGRVESGAISFDLADWRRQPVAVQRRLVLRVADRYRLHDVGFDAVERALQVGEEGGPRRAELSEALVAERGKGSIVFRLRRDLDQ